MSDLSKNSQLMTDVLAPSVSSRENSLELLLASVQSRRRLRRAGHLIQILSVILVVAVMLFYSKNSSNIKTATGQKIADNPHLKSHQILKSQNFTGLLTSIPLSDKNIVLTRFFPQNNILESSPDLKYFFEIDDQKLFALFPKNTVAILRPEKGSPEFLVLDSQTKEGL